MRLGGTLAAITAEKNNEIDFQILWAPIINVEKYLQQCLRSNLATQMATYRKIISTREQMTKDLLEGKLVNIDGYLVSGEFYKQASRIDLLDDLNNFSKPVLIVQIASKERAKTDPGLRDLYTKFQMTNDQAQLTVVQEEPFWSEIKTYYQNAENLFSTTLSWLLRPRFQGLSPLNNTSRQIL